VAPNRATLPCIAATACSSADCSCCCCSRPCTTDYMQLDGAAAAGGVLPFTSLVLQRVQWEAGTCYLQAGGLQVALVLAAAGPISLCCYVPSSYCEQAHPLLARDC